MHKRFVLAVMVMGLLSLFCSGSRDSADSREAPGASVRVDNRNWLDMIIYISQGGQRYRLGRVSGLSTRLFAIPAEFLSTPTVTFLADPVGSREVAVTQEMAVKPGEEVVLTILQ